MACVANSSALGPAGVAAATTVNVVAGVPVAPVGVYAGAPGNSGGASSPIDCAGAASGSGAPPTPSGVAPLTFVSLVFSLTAPATAAASLRRRILLAAGAAGGGNGSSPSSNYTVIGSESQSPASAVLDLLPAGGPLQLQLASVLFNLGTALNTSGPSAVWTEPSGAPNYAASVAAARAGALSPTSPTLAAQLAAWAAALASGGAPGVDFAPVGALVVNIGNGSSVPLSASDAAAAGEEVLRPPPTGTTQSNVGAIVGGVVGGLAGVALIAAGAILGHRFLRRRALVGPKESAELRARQRREKFERRLESGPAAPRGTDTSARIDIEPTGSRSVERVPSGKMLPPARVLLNLGDSTPNVAAFEGEDFTLRRKSTLSQLGQFSAVPSLVASTRALALGAQVAAHVARSRTGAAPDRSRKDSKPPISLAPDDDDGEALPGGADDGGDGGGGSKRRRTSKSKKSLSKKTHRRRRGRGGDGEGEAGGDDALMDASGDGDEVVAVRSDSLREFAGGGSGGGAKGSRSSTKVKASFTGQAASDGDGGRAKPGATSAPKPPILKAGATAAPAPDTGDDRSDEDEEGSDSGSVKLKPAGKLVAPKASTRAVPTAATPPAGKSGGEDDDGSDAGGSGSASDTPSMKPLAPKPPPPRPPAKAAPPSIKPPPAKAASETSDGEDSSGSDHTDDDRSVGSGRSSDRGGSGGGGGISKQAAAASPNPPPPPRPPAKATPISPRSLAAPPAMTPVHAKKASASSDDDGSSGSDRSEADGSVESGRSGGSGGSITAPAALSPKPPPTRPSARTAPLPPSPLPRPPAKVAPSLPTPPPPRPPAKAAPPLPVLPSSSSSKSTRKSPVGDDSSDGGAKVAPTPPATKGAVEDEEETEEAPPERKKSSRSVFKARPSARTTKTSMRDVG